MQADPVIQDTGNPQNWNAYSYVFNNPYRYTDPTGMLGQSERQWLGAIVAIGAAIFTGGASVGWWAASMTVTQALAITVAAGFASGAIATQSFKGGLYGAFGAALTFGVGWAGMQYNWGAGTMLAQAAAGGVLESIQGGSFGNGFAAAGLSAALMPGVGKIGNPAGRAIVGALIGGTLSAATGGKFVNGAVSGAIQGAMAGGNEIADPRDGKGEKPNRALAKEAAGEANNALLMAGAFKPYGTQAEAEDTWASIVGPFQKKHGVELGSHIYQVRKSFVFGPVYSSGNKATILGFWNIKSLSRGMLVGYIHTHPTAPYFSGMDYAENFEGNWVAKGWNYEGDLMSAAGMRIDAAMVHNGRVYRWDYQEFSKAMKMTSDYVRAGDFMK